MNQYFLAKHVLQNEEFSLPLNRDEILTDKYNSIPFAFDDVAEADRVLTTQDYIDVIERRFVDIERYIRKYIESIPHLSGDECMQLIRQYDHFTEQARRVIEAETKFESPESFFLMPDRMKDTVRSLFEYADLESIYNYEEAEKLLTGVRTVTVIVNSNRDNDKVTETIKTRIIDNTVKIEKCRELTAKIEKKFDVKVETLDMYLSIYANCTLDYGGECLFEKEVTYYPADDYLKVTGRNA